MLSRRPRSRAIPGRGIWAGLALTPILIALVALIVSSLVGGAATARATSATTPVGPGFAKARVRPTFTRTQSIAQVVKYWTNGRMNRAVDVKTGQHAPQVPDVVPGGPHTSFNWYPDFTVKPISRNTLIYYRQGGSEHVCSGGVVGSDDPQTLTAVEGATNIVWTAGRCLHTGDNNPNSWSDNIMVCPSHTTAGPLTRGNPVGQVENPGCWVWASESTTPEWFADNWESRDYGVIFLTNTHVAAPCSATTCTVITGSEAGSGANCGNPNPPNGDIANYPDGCPTGIPTNRRGTFTLCNTSSVAPFVANTNCAYNLPRTQAWWAIGYHNAAMLEGRAGTNIQPPLTGVRTAGCTPTGTAAPPRECFPITMRVTQTSYVSTHPALPPNPAATADAGPGLNTVGDYEQAGTDDSRLTGISGTCREQYKGANQTTAPLQTPPCTGAFTGAVWIVGSGYANNGTTGGSSGWNGNEGKFGNTRINSNTSYADVGSAGNPCNASDVLTNTGTLPFNSGTCEDDRPNNTSVPGTYGGSMQGVYFDQVTCFDYVAWTGMVFGCPVGPV